MRVTSEQIAAFAAFADKIVSLGGAQGQVIHSADGVKVVLGKPYVIKPGYHSLPHHDTVAHSAYIHYAGPADPITGADMWSEQTVEELTRAREVIVERGWVQGALMRPGGVCLAGAVIVARSGRSDRRYRVLLAVLTAFLAEQKGWRHTGAVVSWNDDKERTRDEVLDLLHECAIWVKGKIDNG